MAQAGWAKITTKQKVHFLGRVLQACLYEHYPEPLSLRQHFENATLTLTSEDCCTKYQAKGFLPRATKEWNKLPPELRKIKNHLELREKMISNELKIPSVVSVSSHPATVGQAVGQNSRL